MGELVPHPDSAVFGGLPFTCSDLRDFRTHGPRTKIDDRSAPSGRLVARVSAAVTTVDRGPGRWAIFPTADIAFALIFAVLPEGGTGSVDASYDTTTVTQHAPSPTSALHGPDSVAITDPPAPAPSMPGSPARPTTLPSSGRISTRTRRRTAAATGSAPPSVQNGFGPGGSPGSSARRANTSPRVPRPRPPPVVVTAPVPACPDGTHPIRPRPRLTCGKYSFLRFLTRLEPRPPQRTTWMPSTLLLNCG